MHALQHSQQQRLRNGHGSPLALSGTSLRWAVALYCAFIGAFMLVAPDQFSGPTFAPVRGYMTAWAIVALAAGVALLFVAVLRVRRPLHLAAHGLAGLVLLTLSLGLSRSGGWNGTISYAALGVGILVAAGARAHRGGDLLSLVMGAIATLLGAVQLLFPGRLRYQLFGGTHPGLFELAGLALLLSGPALCYVQLRPASGRLTRAVHLAAGAALIVRGAAAVNPRVSWTGIAFYWGIGTAVAMLPWLREWSTGIDLSALRARLALALAVATSLALVAAVAVSTAQEASLASDQATDTLKVEARSVAQNVRDYLDLNGTRAFAVAALASRLPLTSQAQSPLLATSGASYREVSGLLLLDLSGQPIATDGGATLGSNTLRSLAALANPQKVAVQLAIDRVSNRLLLLEVAPVLADGGRLAAALVMAFDARLLEGRILREGSTVSLTDGSGTHIAMRSDGGAPAGDPWSGDGAAPAGRPPGRQVGAPPSRDDRLLAVERVPGLPWMVAVERASDSALAGVNRGRDLAFALLLLVLPLAIAGGILSARRITRPLDTLADAVDELTAGNPWAPLERSDIGEVKRLSAAFHELRDRLATRTAESERLAAELLARARTLAETDRRKDEFLAMLAHELRNPLGAISTAAYILATGRSSEAAAGRSVATIQRQTRHLGRLVDDLLDVSRITLGKVELKTAPLDLGDVIAQVAETTRPLAETRHIELGVSVPGPAPVVADSTRIEQVLANLVHNAIKFTEPGGRVDLTAEVQADRAVVRVRDSGVGISGELLPRVFDLFAQGQQGLDRSVGGLGIGLTLVRSLVELHGGGVAVHSDGPGSGSEFVIWLPLAPAGLPPAAATGVSATSSTAAATSSAATG
jgi:signal transduction histidine kinase